MHKHTHKDTYALMRTQALQHITANGFMSFH